MRNAKDRVALRTLAALAGFVLAGAVSGCGIGPGEDVGGIGLTITREYGRELVSRDQMEDVRESDTVIRVLDRTAEIDTRYGGKFVQAIDGVEGGRTDGRPNDWFFYVNGIESEVGAADVPLRSGDRVWWDYRDWGSAMRVPAVVGSWPEPFVNGYGEKPATTSVTCAGAVTEACAAVREALESAGANLIAADGAVRVLVGPWADLRSFPEARPLEAGPQTSGVFADFERSGEVWSLVGLDERGRPGEDMPGQGLVAATRRFSDTPVWVITGAGPAEVGLAAAALAEPELRDRYAVAAGPDGTEALPLPAP